MTTTNLYYAFVAIVASVIFVPTTVDATSFVYNNDLTCDSPISVSVTKAGCVGSEYCNFGDQISAYGTVTFSDDLPTTSLCLSMKTCINGKSWMCRTFTSKLDVCTDLELQGIDGQTCPEAGQYTFDSDATIPSVGGMNLGSGTFSKSKRFVFAIVFYMFTTRANDFCFLFSG